ncbi:hypothetical protein [Comamonas koreensis]|nr:hypothetical protein [Comamonas koreensis]
MTASERISPPQLNKKAQITPANGSSNLGLNTTPTAAASAAAG